MLVVGSVFVGEAGYAASLWRFVEYGAGMGLVLMFIAVGVALARGPIVRFVGGAMPYVHGAGAGLRRRLRDMVLVEGADMTDGKPPIAGNEAEVVLYTQPHCHACGEVERYLAEREVPFAVRDVFADADALEEIASRGYLATPVTRIGDEWIAGFRREAFAEALARLASR